MQIYDEANALARAIRESEDCRAYRQLRQEIESDETARALLREYKKLQMQLQLAAVAGAEVSNDDTQRFQQIGALLFAGENTSRFLLLEMRLGEGSGCPLMFQVMKAACAVMNTMATFSEAEINDGYLDEIRKIDAFTVKQK